MNDQSKKERPDIQINKIIIETSAIIVVVFPTIGLVMSQTFPEGSQRFYELLGWATSLAMPFIISSIISTIIVGYYREMSTRLFRELKLISILAYVVAWCLFILNAYIWSPQWTWQNFTLLCVYLSVLIAVYIIVRVRLIVSTLAGSSSRREAK